MGQSDFIGIIKEDHNVKKLSHHEYLVGRACERLQRMRDLVKQFDRASEDRTKLEIAGRLINLLQKVIL